MLISDGLFVNQCVVKELAKPLLAKSLWFWLKAYVSRLTRHYCSLESLIFGD